MSKLAPVKQRASLLTLKLLLSHYRQFELKFEVNEFNTGYMLRIYNRKKELDYIVRSELFEDVYTLRVLGLGKNSTDSKLIHVSCKISQLVRILRGVVLNAEDTAQDGLR